MYKNIINILFSIYKDEKFFLSFKNNILLKKILFSQNGLFPFFLYKSYSLYNKVYFNNRIIIYNKKNKYNKILNILIYIKKKIPITIQLLFIIDIINQYSKKKIVLDKEIFLFKKNIKNKYESFK